MAARLDPARSAPLGRRLGAMVYECVLLFGVTFIAGYLFDTLTQSRNALMYRHGREIWLFLIYGAYFVYLWTHGGQTLAMKTWRIRLVWRDDQPVPLAIAMLRYCACWFFILLGPALAKWLGFAAPLLALSLLLSLLLPPLLMLLLPSRQFIHDELIGTSLVNVARKDAVLQSPA